MDQEFGQGIKIRSPRGTRIGDEHIQSLAGVIAPGISFDPGCTVQGPGFVFNVEADSQSEKMKFNVSFPRFPDAN